MCVCACSVRQGATEIHNVAAFIGGVASQEALKVSSEIHLIFGWPRRSRGAFVLPSCAQLLTKQFTPINNTFLFNGMHGSALTFDF